MDNKSLTLRDQERLVGVHADLIRVVERARKMLPFIVTEGVRTLDRQKELVKQGASHTMNSRHLTGHAVDLAALVGTEVRWDWPLYDAIGAAMKAAGAEEGVSIVWGGDWPTFRDGPHFELSRVSYP